MPNHALQDFVLPPNVNATTAAAEAIAGAQFAIHAVPVQHTRAFLQSIKVRRAARRRRGGCTGRAAQTARSAEGAPPALRQ